MMSMPPSWLCAFVAICRHQQPGILWDFDATAGDVVDDFNNIFDVNAVDDEPSTTMASTYVFFEADRRCWILLAVGLLLVRRKNWDVGSDGQLMCKDVIYRGIYVYWVYPSPADGQIMLLYLYLF